MSLHIVRGNLQSILQDLFLCVNGIGIDHLSWIGIEKTTACLFHSRMLENVDNVDNAVRAEDTDG